jgi:hypothetical protein
MKNSVLSPLAALVLVWLLHAPSAVAQAENSSGISLEIRCTEQVLKAGDAIPIQFIVKNNGTKDYTYTAGTYDRSGRMSEYKLTARTASGGIVPNPVKDFNEHREGSYLMGELHPGASFAKIIPLNGWALIIEPGRYEVTGSFDCRTEPANLPLTKEEMSDYIQGLSNQVEAHATANSAPISLTILPRTKEEMRDYIQDLSNQVEAQLVIQAGKNGGPFNEVLGHLLPRLAYTCSPEVVPVLLRSLYAVGTDTGFDGNVGFWTREALLYYVPRTAETRQVILYAAIRQGLNWSMNSLLTDYGFTQAELKPLIDRALGALNRGEWEYGAGLAASVCYDDAFTAPLIAIACNSNAPVNARGAAAEALARNRTDAGVKALKTLLNEPNPEIGARLVQGLQNGYAVQVKTPSGRHLQPGDFTAAEVRPLTERLLASKDNTLPGVNLARMFPDDTLTPTLVTIAKDPRSPFNIFAIYALALNRTDEGVAALKNLLNGPNRSVVEDAIRNSYLARNGEPGRPLRPDDFDAKYQHRETTPPK